MSSYQAFFLIFIFPPVVTSVRVQPPPRPLNPIPAVPTGYYMSVIILLMAGFAGVAFFTIILLMCLKRRKRWKRRKRFVKGNCSVRLQPMGHRFERVQLIMLKRRAWSEAQKKTNPQ